MGLQLFLCALVMAPLACTQVAIATVNLSSDAMPIPGGYVVPERGNVTFTCSSTSGGLLWTVDLKIPGRRRELTDSAGLNFPQVSSMDTPLANPASFTIYNVSSENNQSLVECTDRSSEMRNATIIVEGSPSCPAVYTTSDAAFLTVTVQKSQMIWLPEWYCVEIISHNELTASIAHNLAPKAAVSFNVTTLQPGTVYNISVIPCNMAGCNESCDIHSVQTKSGENGSGDIPHSLPISIIIIIVVTILVTMALLALLLLVILGSKSVIYHIRRRRN